MTAAAIAKQERTAGSYRTLRNDVRSLARPALEGLVSDGVLVDLGNWYRVPRPEELPTQLWFGARILHLGGLMLINFDADMQDDPA